MILIKTPLSKLHKGLWKIFSVFIRLRDADENGYAPCISCGKIHYWKDGDSGHFINRKYPYLLYDENNNNFQCRTCNRFTEGNQSEYRVRLVKKIGEAAVKQLEDTKNYRAGFTREGLVLRIKEYKAKIDELKRHKI